MKLTAEQLARTFHSSYEELAPHFGYETKEDSRTDWDKVPETNKMLMVATAAQVIAKLGLEAKGVMRGDG